MPSKSHMQKLGKGVLVLAAIALIYEALVPQFIVTSIKVFGRQIYSTQRRK